MPEVVLRDFDGTETIFPRDPPLPEIIHTGQEDDETHVLITRHYLRTTEVDREGRPVYLQSNL
jgi:hypothetical protein